jgi:hypothetical protein
MAETLDKNLTSIAALPAGIITDPHGVCAAHEAGAAIEKL